MLLSGVAEAQIVTESLEGGTVTAEQLAAVLAGPSISISNVRYTGAPIASGSFSGGLAPIGIESGILLTSGAAANVIGPNNVDNRTRDNGLPGDPDLDALVGGGTLDSSALEFDFVSASAATITFRYVFGSEEYNEFVNSQFNDVFALFVNGQNCALIPGTLSPVTINTVNLGLNSTFFVNNSPGLLDTQLDGLTTTLDCVAAVVPGATNTLKLVIADRADRVLDSAIFLQADSLVAGFMPTAELAATPTSGFAPLDVSFSTVGSMDQDGPLAGYSLDFGDGTPPATGSGAPPDTLLHTYAVAGNYDAVLTVTDSDGNSDSAMAAVEVLASADLSIVKSASSNVALVNDTLTYTLVVSNAGPGGGSDVVVTDALPASTSFVGVASTQGSCAVIATTVTCELGSIASGGLASISLTVRPTAAGILVNTASVTGSGVDPTPSNNTSSATVAVNRRTPTLIAEPVVLSVGGGNGLQLRLRFEARLSEGDVGVPGQSLAFSAAGQTCTGTTNTNGVATCTLTVSRLLASVLTLGYRADYGGNPVYLPATDRGPIIQLGGISVF